MATVHRFKRPCIKCDKTFKPDGKYQKMCNNCNKNKNTSKSNLKTRYFKSKEELDIISSNATLAKWKVLSRSYKLGKKIWGVRFTRQRLAHDMDMPMTTVLRCLSLDKATKKSMKLMKDGKISASRLSMVCQSKSAAYQDEIVKTIIDNNYSTYQIKSLKIKNLADINKEKLRLAVENGFSRKDALVRSFENWIDKGRLLLLVKKEKIDEKKYNKIMEDLKLLHSKIERFVDD